ncbi:LacI family DNA-binding transcriptional regulator [Leucobacter sp. HY1908]
MRAQGRRTTIKDVARAAGVSPATVSLALNGKTTVNKQTAERVRRVAREQGYRAHAIARGLRTSSFGILGLIIRPLHTLENPMPQGVDFFMRLAGAAALTALDRGYTLMLVGDPTQPDSPNSALAADAFIVLMPHENDPILTTLDAAQIPFVTVGADPARPDAFAAIDTRIDEEMRVMLDHFWAQGARRPALVVGTKPNGWRAESLRHYAQWCRGRGIAARAGSHPEALGEAAGEAIAGELFGSKSDAGGTSAGASAGNAELVPDAVYCLTGRHADGLLTALTARGLSVPGDVLVAAASGAPANLVSTPAVTTLDLHPDDLARTAVDAAIAVANGEAPAAPLRGPAITLTARASTARG